MFKLEHPFDRAVTANSFAEGDLRDNLMEYYGGTELVKLQWDAIHKPGTIIGIFERDEDAMQKLSPGFYYWHAFEQKWKLASIPSVYNDEYVNTLGYFSFVQANKIEEERKRKAEAIEATNRNIMQQKAQYNWEMSQNIFYIIYQLSPAYTAKETVISIANEEYGWATLYAALTLIDVVEISSILKTGQSFIGPQLDKLWKSTSFSRNTFFKSRFLGMKYKNAVEGVFPIIDFLEDGVAIVFRSVDDFAQAEAGLIKTIDNMVKAKNVGSIAGMTGEIKINSIRLDIGLPPGGAVPEHIVAYANKNNIFIHSFEIIEEGGQIIAKVSGSVSRVSIQGMTNTFRATVDEVAEAAAKIKNHRVSVNQLKGGNYGYLEGAVNNRVVDSKMWRSGQALESEPQIFKAINIEGVGGSNWLRNTDSEYKMLNKLADDLGGKAGMKYPNINGELKIISENPYCTSCQGVIQQFNEMFPNIKLILTDGVK